MKNQFRAIEMFTLDDGKTIAGVTSDGAAFFDYDGNEIKRFDLGLKEFSKTSHNITPNGKYLFIRNTNPDKIFDLSDSTKVAYDLDYKKRILEFYTDKSKLGKGLKHVKSRSIFNGDMILGPNGEYLYNRFRGKVARYNIISGEIKSIFSGRGKTFPGHFAILN